VRLGLEGQVRHWLGDGLELPFDDASFDVVWTQNSGMNIAGKERLYSGFSRVLRTGGMLTLQEPMNGPVQPLVFPVMWATEASMSFLRTPEEMRAVIEAAGFRQREWHKMPSPSAAQSSTGPASIQQLVMSDSLPAMSTARKRNAEENRQVNMQGIFDRL